MLQDIASVVTAVAALGALVWSIKNGKKIDEVSINVDGRLSELLKLTGQSSHAEGVIQGREEQKAGDQDRG